MEKKATVKTQEEWIFKRVNPENKKSIQSGKKVFYDGKYTLEKSKEGKLVVSNLVAKEIGPRKLENMKPYR